MQSNDELQALKHFITAHQGQFALSIVRINEPTERNRLVEELVHGLDAENITARVVDYSSHRVPSLLDDLHSRFADHPDAILIIGLERAIVDVGDDDRTWPRILNQQRESFHERFHCPLAIWLTDYAADKLFEGAPDFADWHAVTFRFDLPLHSPTYEDLSPAAPGAQRSERIELLERRRVELLKAVPQNRLRLGQIYRELGRLYTNGSKNQERQAGVGLLLEAVKLFEQLGHKDQLALADLELGNVYYWLREFDKSRQHYRRAYDLGCEVGDETLTALAAQGRGLTERAIDLQSSDSYFQEALQRFRRLGYRRAEGDIFRHLGHNRAARHDYEGALRFYQKAQELCREFSDASGEGNVLQSRAAIHIARNELKRAERLVEQAREKFQQGNDQFGLANVLLDLGRIRFLRKQWAESVPLLEESVRLYHELGQRHSEGIALQQLSVAFSELGRSEDADTMKHRATAVLADIA